MTIHELLNIWTPKLAKNVSPRERAVVDLETELILAHVLKCDRSHVIAHENDAIDPRSIRSFERLAKRRTAHEPMAYILGHRAFYGREFFTDKRALIPRPETELLVDRALAILKADPNDTLVWDVGTGSGAIATTIALEQPATTVLATDIDVKAIALARKNAKHLNAKTIHFLKADLLDRSVKTILATSPATHLLILANLPYLPMSDKKVLDPDVVQFEPHRALFTGEHGLMLIQKFLRQLSVFQKKDCRPLTVLLEYDPPQTKVLTAIAKKLFPNAIVSIHQDLCGRDRIFKIQTEN